ncbi:Zinc finger protein [Wickerhamomyces ciferrii]|uniref:Zinc finger protein n=1 Tax=Wickerhamomyces ciferrii (strain ATCC 14091 / BCRC 22168 / CBS 111 / JCM 3599 / NBRC 0793 / NRRL Y-1031 F-60-10) TaxID=1206466 RepID=K0KXB6_WICCF|nr:Zinc finger protein [Wickerhamomyces ciferrii]CCH46124.1 Zinc finger protein [Wickerhamomyces ciferrii]
MNTNSFFNQPGAISIPNSNSNSTLSQPIDISGYQRSGSVFNNNFNTTSNQQNQQSSNQLNQQSSNQLQNQQHNQQQVQSTQSNSHQQHHQPQHNNNYLSTNSININNHNNHKNFRRDSIAHSQGVGGISWGSVTIGSWLKDEVLMHNNFNQNSNNNQISMSPPIQSAYLPDLEANYCKDYSCCGQLLPTLHDLLKHYEESHISPTPPTHQPKPIQNFETVSTTDVFINSNNNGNNLNNVHDPNNNNNNNNNPNNNNNFGFNQSPFQQQQQNLQHLRQQLQPQNSTTNALNHHQNHHQHLQQQHLQQQHNNNNNLHQNNNNHNNHPNLQQNNLQNINQQNSNYQLQQNLHNNQQVNLTNSQLNNQSSQHSAPFPISLSNDDSAMDLDEEMDEGYIDDPSRNLYVAQGNEKPFTCPVIGCNKTYKNQNGLKYHRLHGHQNQKLHMNPDGTYSVIDPNDGNGMEQDKPYRCEVCGKRYKNLNGLKYHRGHSTH